MKRTYSILILSALCLLSQAYAQPGEPGRGPVRAGKGEGRGNGHRPATDRYMRRLRRENPEEFETLKRLRREDPESFREKLREKAMRRRGEWNNNGGPKPLQEEMQALLRAGTAEERQAAEAALRKKIGERVDARLERREEHMEQIRKKLAGLEAQHREDLERREELIEQTMHRIRMRIQEKQESAELPTGP